MRKNEFWVCVCAVCAALLPFGCSSTKAADGSAFETMAYITGTQGADLVIDRVEWVNVPSERANELAITEDDAPGGFSVYNPKVSAEKVPLSATAKIVVLDWRDSYKPTEISPEEFLALLKERGEQNEFIPYTISIKAGTVVSIEEHYVP